MSKKITPAFIKSIHILQNNRYLLNRPFYAEDMGLNGGQIGSLSCAGVIRPTGNTKKSYYDLDDTHARICYAKEWVIDNRRYDTVMHRLNGERRNLRARIDGYKETINKLEEAISILCEAGF